MKIVEEFLRSLMMTIQWLFARKEALISPNLVVSNYKLYCEIHVLTVEYMCKSEIHE